MNTELHCHLDIAFRLPTLLDLAQARGLVPRSTSLATFQSEFVLHSPLADLASVIDRFTLFQKVLDRPEVLERVAFEVVEDSYRDGIGHLELRFSPSFVAEYSKLTWDAVLDAFERGMKKGLAACPGMRAGLICIATRDYGPESVDEVVEFCLKHGDRFIGVDLAGKENGFPCRLFEASFRKAQARGMPITIHAGEAAGAENVWEAIDLLGASRIGHGIRSWEDPTLVRYLADKQVCLEMCPTSNWLTGTVTSLEEHPLPRFLRAGVPVSINTDDPTIFGTSLSREIEICWKRMGLSNSELWQCDNNAAHASFLR